MSKTITDYDPATTIDGSNDYFLIEQGGVYKKINRSILTGLSSAPVGLTDSQTITTKVLDNTNQITLKGTKFTLQDDTDTTKQARFLMSSITTGTTRSYTLPDASATLVGTSATQTLTNKTITSPTISGGTIDNATITVDSISGHSVSTTVTIANLQIANGVLNSANAVTATSIADGAIEPKALVSGTGTGWAWTSWTPTLANLTLGNGSVTASYIQIGKTVFFKIFINFGSTTSMGTGPTFTLPVTAVSYNVTMQVGQGAIYDSSANGTYQLIARITSTTVANIQFLQTENTVTITATTPITWAVNDGVLMQGFYEAA